MSAANSSDGSNPFAHYSNLTQPITGSDLVLRLGLPVLLIPLLCYICIAHNMYEKKATKPTFIGYIKYTFTCLGRFSKQKIKTDEDQEESRYRTTMRMSKLPRGFSLVYPKGKPTATFDHEAQQPKTEFFRDELEQISQEITAIESEWSVPKIQAKGASGNSRQSARLERRKPNLSIQVGKSGVTSPSTPRVGTETGRATFASIPTLTKPSKSLMKQTSRVSLRPSSYDGGVS